MKSICFFNNKGGVGKTTLICNVASYLATTYNLRVLLVDADPQCNSTQLVIGDEKASEIYQSTRVSPVKKVTPQVPAKYQTLLNTLRPIAVGDANISPSMKFAPRSENRFRIDLLPGHPSLSLLEDRLSQEWLELKGGQIPGVRKTNWATQLCANVSELYDFVFFDVGPSLGALNRSVLLGVDYFVTPMGCDIFSLIGIYNINQWLSEWRQTYADGLEQCKKAGYEEELNEYPITIDVNDAAQFIGYTVQQYITKTIRGERRATAAYEKIMKDIPKTVKEELQQFSPAHLEASDLSLGDVPNMYSLIPLAQKASAPIHALEREDGVTGTQYTQKSTYVLFIQHLAEAVMRNADSESNQ